MEATFQTEDLRVEGEPDRLAEHIKPLATYVMTLDESLPPWGIRLEGNVLFMGRAAKLDSGLCLASDADYKAENN